MLDNPNLTQEVIFDLISDGKDIIGISLLIVVIIIIYINRYQVALFLKYGFSNNKNDMSPFGGLFGQMKTDFSELAKKDISTKIDDLLMKFNQNKNLVDYNEQLNNDLESNLLRINKLPPSFRKLKIKRTSNELVYYFVNDGGSINKIKFKPIGAFNISIEPKDKIEVKGTGYLKFVIDNIEESELHFILSYYDCENIFFEIKYFFSLLENKLFLCSSK